MYPRRIVRVVLVVLAAGCASPAPEQRSGARLRAQYWDLDGLRVPRGFFDSARSEECMFDPARGAGGVSYCLPKPRASKSRWFADAACTEPLAVAPGPCTVPKYAVFGSEDACAAPPTVFHIGAPVALVSAFGIVDGQCKPSTQISGFENPLYRIGAKVAMSEFVAAQEEAEATEHRIEALSLLGDDGSRLRIGAWDTQRREASGVVGPGGRWTPVRVAYVFSNLFSDAACSRAAATKIAHDAICPLTAAIDLSSGPAAIRELGARVGTLYQSAMGTCSMASAYTKMLSFEVGAPVPVDAFEPGQTIEVGAGRIRARQLARSDGTPVMAEGTGPYMNPGDFVFRDTLRNEACRLLPLPDSKAACLPLRGSVFVYSDPACVQRALRVERGLPVPGYSTEDPYSPAPDCANPPAPLVWAVGAKVSENSYYSRIGTSCMHFQDGSESPVDYYALAPVPLTDFVTATAKTD